MKDADLCGLPSTLYNLSLIDQHITPIEFAFSNTVSALALQTTFNTLDTRNAIGIIYLKQIIGQNSIHTSLTISDSLITSKPMAFLANAISSNKSVLSLEFRYCKLSESSIASVIEALYNNNTIRHFALDNCSIGTCGAEALSKMLLCNRSIQSISIKGEANINGELLEPLLIALENNWMLTEIIHSDANSLKSKEIAAELQKNKALRMAISYEPEELAKAPFSIIDRAFQCTRKLSITDGVYNEAFCITNYRNSEFFKYTLVFNGTAPQRAQEDQPFIYIPCELWHHIASFLEITDIKLVSQKGR